jgi:hypothetical protein
VLASVRSGDREALWSQLQFNCLHLVVNVADHLRALGIVTASGAAGLPIYAHATLARVAVESAAWLGYILDHDQVFETRFARGIAHMLADADAARRGASKIPGNPYMTPPGAQAARRCEELHALIGRPRIELVAGGKDIKGVRVTRARRRNRSR